MMNVVATLDDKISNDTCYCATFQLIWNDLKEKLVKGNIVFDSNNEMVNNLNKSLFNENMISDDYYYKVYGLKNLKLKKEIEESIKKKFNTKSDILDSFNWTSASHNYFFYTMLYREFAYEKRFDVLKNDTFSNYKNTKYFGILKNSNYAIRKQIEVLFYDSALEFAFKLITKDESEIIFYKNPKGNTFNEIYNNLKEKTESYNGDHIFNDGDYFKAPIINLNVLKEYYEVQGKIFKLYDGNEACIENAIQTINLTLDEKGGKIKSEAAMDIKVMSFNPYESRYFYVDNTFALFIKEKDKNVPYFAALINDITKCQ